jgi:mono/diheme cytochrome c family protein
VYGKDLFTFYCSSCHGRDGKGAAGSDASAARPPDLTTLTTRAGKALPRERVAAIIRGDVSPITPAHGSKEMPVWGPIFRSLDPHDAMNAERIGNIVEYLESIQGK